jgi:hypothetical protein
MPSSSATHSRSGLLFSTHFTDVVYTDPGHPIAKFSSKRLCHHTSLLEPKEGKAARVANFFSAVYSFICFCNVVTSAGFWGSFSSVFSFSFFRLGWAHTYTEHSSLSFIRSSLSAQNLPA